MYTHSNLEVLGKAMGFQDLFVLWEMREQFDKEVVFELSLKVRGEGMTGKSKHISKKGITLAK